MFKRFYDLNGMSKKLTNEGNSFEKLAQSFSRILVVNPVRTLWSYQFSLEAALGLAIRGSKVSFIDLSQHEDPSYLINEKQYISPILYRNVARSVGKIMKKSSVQASRCNRLKLVTGKVPKFRNVEELRAYNFNGIAFGAMIYSAITSKYKSTSFTIEEIESDVNHYFKFTMMSYRNLEVQFRKMKPDLVITTNDRLIGSAMALNISKHLGISSRVIYWGSDPSRFELYTRSLYDSREWFSLSESKFRQYPPSPESMNVLIQQIDHLSKTQTEDSLSFTRNQISGLGLELKGKTCVFYAQSEHEHSAVFVDAIEGRFASQQTAFLELMKICKDMNINLVLKYHPIRNLVGNSDNNRNETGDWANVPIEDWVIQILPDSPIDTYKLIDMVDFNIVWTSTVGLETILRQKNVIVTGDAHWLNLEWNIHAWDSRDLKRLISGDLIIPKLKSLIPWFWYLQEYGTPFQITNHQSGNLYLQNGDQVLHFRFFHRLLKRFFG